MNKYVNKYENARIENRRCDENERISNLLRIMPFLRYHRDYVSCYIFC